MKSTARRIVPVLSAFFALSLLAAPVSAEDAGQSVSFAGSKASTFGPAKNFSGRARVDRVFDATREAPYTAAYVSFEPGAHTNWHRHVAGQHLIVVYGVGLTGTEDGKVTVIKAGDEVWCPPNVKHWHGAAPDTAMVHLAITGVRDGKNTEWLEPLSEEQYKSGRSE